MSEAEDTATVCDNKGKKILSSQFAVVECDISIGIYCVADGIPQSLTVILYLLFGLLLDGIRLIFQIDMVFAEILVKAALFQVELTD